MFARRVLDASQHLFSYTAHAMGANTLSMILRPAILGPLDPSSNSCNTTAPSPSLSSTSAPAPVGGSTGTGTGTRTGIKEGLSWGVLIVSGGDDQAISICSATLSLALNEVRIRAQVILFIIVSHNGYYTDMMLLLRFVDHRNKKTVFAYPLPLHL
jgi:hypothetical protein